MTNWLSKQIAENIVWQMLFQMIQNLVKRWCFTRTYVKTNSPTALFS